MEDVSNISSIFVLYFSFLSTFLLTGCFCFWKDLIYDTNSYTERKIQKSNRIDTMLQYRKCISTVISNIFIVIPVISIILTPLSPVHFYSFSDLYKFPINFVLIDILFYLSHRLMHVGFLYKKFHKKHHEIKKPISISALYLHPVDLIFSNFFPVVLPPFILGQGLIAFSLWIIISIFNTVYISHQGIKNLSEFHDYHHEKSMYNYGAELFMDRLFGTYKTKEEYKAKIDD